MLGHMQQRLKSAPHMGQRLQAHHAIHMGQRLNHAMGTVQAMMKTSRKRAADKIER
jgi:hypothetical protein